jgi:hypothetical protein
MWYCITHSNNNKPIFQAKIKALCPHTAATETHKEPIFGMYVTEFMIVDKDEWDKVRINYVVHHSLDKDKNREIWIRLLPLRGDYHWGIWNEPYKAD